MVASNRPPRPTSTTQASAGTRANSRNAAATVTSKKARAKVFACVQHFGQHRSQPRVGNQFARNPDALVIADEMRAGGDVDPLAVRFQHGAQERASRALAVRARDVEHRRQAPLRIAETREQCADRLQPQPALRHRQGTKPIELGLDRRIVRPREIAHDASGGRLRFEIAEQVGQRVAQVAAMHDHVDHAVPVKIFGPLEPVRQLFANGILDHTLARETGSTHPVRQDEYHRAWHSSR